MATNILTLERFRAIPHGKVFATGIIENSPNGIFMTRDGGHLRWVAKKGWGFDWAIYCHWSNRPKEYVILYGDKVHNDTYITNCVPCSSAVLNLYRH